MGYPAFPVPQPVREPDLLYRHEPPVCQDRLSFRNTGQFSDLALLPQMPVDTVLDHGNMEHGGCAGTVNVAVLPEHLLPPGLTGQPCDDPRLDGGEVGHDEPASLFWHERGTDQLLQYIGRAVVQNFQGSEVAGTYQFPRLFQVRQMVLRQVLHLDKPSGKPSGPVRPVKLQESPSPAVTADHVLHGLIFFYRRLCQFQPEQQRLPNFACGLCGLPGHLVPGHGFHLHTPGSQPVHHLYRGIRVLQPGDIPGPFQRMFAKLFMATECRLHQRPV